MLNKLLKIIFFLLIIKPIILIIIGLNIRFRERLPIKGPCVLVANHNSHLDTMVIMSLFPLSKLWKVRPVAAADYFMKNKFLSWFSRHVIGIIPLQRDGVNSKEALFNECHQALNNNEILILFPEGSRGEPEKIGQFKKGLAHLIKQHPDCKVIPIFMHGLGKSMPKGSKIPVPFFCDVVIGNPMTKTDDATEFTEQLTKNINDLSSHAHISEWS